jgi:uncharacterized membrane protein
MLELYGRLAERMAAWAWLPWIGTLVGLLAFLTGVLAVEGETGQRLSLAAIILVLWSLALSAFLRAFATPLPQPSNEPTVLRRIVARLRRLYRWCLAAAVTALLGALGWFSLRAILVIGAA